MFGFLKDTGFFGKDTTTVALYTMLFSNEGIARSNFELNRLDL
jgi:hypothetical protein